MQIKILKIFAQLCKGSKSNSELVYRVIEKTISRADNINTDVSYAIVHQAILTSTRIFPDNGLLEQCSGVVKKFLNSGSKSNLIYMGLMQLKSLTEIKSDFIGEH